MSTKHNIYGSLHVNDNITGDTLNILTVNNNNSLTQILGKNSVSGNVEYIDVSSIVGSVSADTYVVSGNADSATSQLSFTYNTGGTFTVANSAALFSDNDINVTGGTYNPSTGCVTFATNSGTTFDVCGFVTGITDSYTTGSTLVGESIQFDNNILGSNYYNVNLTPALSGKTNLSLFNSHTANTVNPHQTSFGNLVSTAHTHSISEVINLQSELDDKLDVSAFNSYSGDVSNQLSAKIENGINLGSANEIFSGKSGTDFYFRTISGGTNATITTVGDIVNIDVETDITRVQGGTNITTGGTVNSPIVSLDSDISLNSVSATTLSGGTIYSGSTDLSDIFLTTADGNDITRVQPGTNITTGGTANNPIINVDDSPVFNSLITSGQTTINSNFTVTGNTLISGTTTIGNDLEPNVDNIVDLGAPSLRWREIYTTNLDATNAVTANSLYAGFEIESPSISGTSVSATTFYSGSTDLSDIFLTTADGNDITRVQPGNNINTGGTANNPIVNLDDDISLISVSATTISGGTFYGDGSNLSGINDFYLTGQTFNNSNYILTSSLNDGSVLNSDLSVLASDIFVISGVYSPSTGVVTYTNSSGGTFNVSGFTTGMTDSYTNAANLNGNLIEFDNNIQGSNFYNVDLSPALSAFTTGDTFVTGYTYDDNNTFTISDNLGSAFTATINQVSGLTTTNFIDYANTSDPSAVSGRTYYDVSENALSYFPETPNMDVTINIGQESVTRVYNNTGVQINNGQACHFNGSFSGCITVDLAIASGVTNVTDTTFEVSGIATHDIPNGTEGFITNLGLVRDLTITGTSVGSPIYLSDTIAGELMFSVPTTNSSRISQIGYVVSTGVTTGKIIVEISNESTTGVLSAKEIDVISQNNSSTTLRYGGLLSATSVDTISISAGEGHITDNFTDPNDPILKTVIWDTITGVTITDYTGSPYTYIFLDENADVVQMAFDSPPTPNDKRDKIFLGYATHIFKDSVSTLNSPIPALSPINQLEDFVSSIGPFSINGNIIKPINGTLELQKTEGKSFFYGRGFQDDNANPSIIDTPALSGSTLLWSKGTDFIVNTGNTIDTTNYDLNGLGTITALGNNQYTAHRIWHFPGSNALTFQYGQVEYATLNEGITNYSSESFVVTPALDVAGYLVAVIVAEKGITDLTSSNVKIIPQGKFAGSGGGGSTGLPSDVTSGNILVADGVEFNSVAMGGDATIASDGTITVVGGGGTDSIVQTAKVDEAGGINKGQCVWISGAIGGLPTVSLADNSIFSDADVLAVSTETKADSQNMLIITNGLLENINTLAFTEGDVLYLGTGGTITNIHPTGINAVQRVGHAIKINVSTGSILINMDPLTIINNHNGQMRHQLVNQNTGFSASVSYTMVNDSGHYSSLNYLGSGFLGGGFEALGLYNQGYGNTIFTVDGDKDFKWYTDTGDTHNQSATEKLRLNAAGDLILYGGSVSATTYYGDGSNLTGIPDIYVTGGTYNDTTNNINFSGNSTETTFDVDLTDLVSSVSGDTFVVGGTYVDSTNTIALLRNDGNFVNVTGVTNTYVTGGTVSVSATDNSNGGTIGLFYKDSDGIPRTLPFEDTYTSGTTFASNQATLTRNDGTEVLKLTGDTNVVLSNPSANQVKIGLDLGIKSGFVSGIDFTGNPKTYKVIFTTPYSNTDYSINITGVVNRNYTFQDKTAASFVINANANTSFTDIVDWTTIKYGEQ